MKDKSEIKIVTVSTNPTLLESLNQNMNCIVKDLI